MSEISYCTVQELKELIDSGKDCQIVDVREIAEYNTVRLKNSILAPLSVFPESMKIIDNSKPSYYLCGIGKRALKAAEFLEGQGYKNLIVIDGGIKSWIENAFPVEAG